MTEVIITVRGEITSSAVLSPCSPVWKGERIHIFKDVKLILLVSLKTKRTLLVLGKTVFFVEGRKTGGSCFNIHVRTCLSWRLLLTDDVKLFRMPVSWKFNLTGSQSHCFWVIQVLRQYRTEGFFVRRIHVVWLMHFSVTTSQNWGTEKTLATLKHSRLWARLALC